MQSCANIHDEELLQTYLPEVRKIALSLRRRLPRHIELDDLVGAGSIGFIQALQRFDAARNANFWAYASRRIRGAMIDSLRASDTGTRHLRRRERDMNQAAWQAGNRLGRVASQQELADQMDTSLDDLQELQARLHKLDTISVDGSILQMDDDDAAADQIASDAPDPFDRCAHTEVKTLLAQVLRELPGRDRTLLQLYYYEELTMKEVGQVLGIDESRVSQIHAVLMRQLRYRVQQLVGQRAAIAL